MPSRWLVSLVLLFVGSGAAALIYEIVWFQLLQLVIGSSTVSLGILLGTFMGGMCLGSLLLARVVSARHHPLRVYAWLELGIGGLGILVLLLMPVVGGLYTAWGGDGLTGLLVRGAVAAICLLPPTLLMGATLPAVARWVEMTPAGVSWLGFFYGGNIAGAVFGCLLAGFYLLRVYDVATATYVAAGINVTVAVIGLAIASRTPLRTAAAAATPPATSGERPSHAGLFVYVAIGVSGLCALAAEVLWTRQLTLLFGPSVYAFSIILAVFLLGLGFGSTAGAFLSRRVTQPRAVLGWCQVLVAVAVFWTAYMLAESLPFWPIFPLISISIWFDLQLDLVRAFLTVFPAAVLWGASFPLALAALAAKGQDPGQLVGRVYAANTVGAIIGALASSLLLIGWMGSQHVHQLIIALSATAGLLVLVPPTWKALVSIAVAGLLIPFVPPVSPWLVGHGRFAARFYGATDFVYVGEGVHTSVAVSRDGENLFYHNSGKIQASNQLQDMRLQRMLAHLTTLVPADPRSVLVIGYGAGITAGAIGVDPRVQRVTIAEIEPLVPDVAATYFSRWNQDVGNNRKVQLRVDDGRHYLQTSGEMFDAITSDMVDPWVKGTAMLFTKEFFELGKAHLNPGGVITLFVQLYQTNPEAVKSTVATFLDVFPDGVIFGNTHLGVGYDMVLIGSDRPIQINLDEIDQRLRRPEYGPIAVSMRNIGMPSVVELFGTYAGRRADLEPWLKGAPINHDRDLRLQYIAGLGMNLSDNAAIYQDMVKYRRFPEGLFIGSPPLLDAMRNAMYASK